MPDLEEMVKWAAKGRKDKRADAFSDDIIQALKEAMKNSSLAGKVAAIDSEIAKLFERRRNHQILNINYKGEQLFPNVPQLNWIKSSNPEIFTSGTGLTTYSELLDYAMYVPARSIKESSERRKTLITKALKEKIGEETVNSYLESRRSYSAAPVKPRMNNYRLIPSAKMGNIGAAAAAAHSDIVIKYPDKFVYFPTYQFSRGFLDWFQNNAKAMLRVSYQRHRSFEGKKSRYPRGIKDGFYFRVLAKDVSVTEDFIDQATVHVLRFPNGRYLLASEVRRIVDFLNGQEVFLRPADVFYEGGVKHKKWNPHDAMSMPKYRKAAISQ